MMASYDGPYLLYDEETGECHGEYPSIREAIEVSACLKSRTYFLATSLETGHEMVLDTEEFDKALTEYWEEKYGRQDQ